MSTPRQRIPVPPPVEFDVSRLDLGLVLDVDNRDAPLESATVAELVRFENRGVRKEYGRTNLGLVAPGRVIGIIEHRYFRNEIVVARLVRLSRLANGSLSLDVWGGAGGWLNSANYPEIEAVYLSLVSMHGLLVMADGRRVLKWRETPVTEEVGNDFAPGLALNALDECSNNVLIDPAGAVAGYTFNFKITWTNVSSNETAHLQLKFKHNGTHFATRIIDYSPGLAPDATTVVTHEINIRRPSVVLNDTLTMCVGPFEGVQETTESDFLEVSSDLGASGLLWQFIADKHWLEGDGPGVFKDYHFRFVSKIPENGSLKVNFLILGDRGSGWEIISSTTGTWVWSANEPGETYDLETRDQAINVEDVPLNSRAVMYVDWEGSSAEIQGMTLADGPIRTPYTFEMDSSGSELTYVVKPYSMSDGDPELGITYEVETGDVDSEISLLSEDVPGARFIAAFADRLISMRDFEDAQVLAASADGDIEDWEGVDTYNAALTDTVADPIDDLMGLAHLAPGVAALFRKRSIFRVAETGNVDLPIANIMWTDRLGTESPFSIQSVEGGIAFLGHDKMVYILSEQGPRPISVFVHDEMIEKLSDSALALVDSAYEPVAGQYYLAIPTNESAFCTEIWIFDVKAYWLSEAQIMPWRKITTNVERLGSITEIPLEIGETPTEY